MRFVEKSGKKFQDMYPLTGNSCFRCLFLFFFHCPFTCWIVDHKEGILEEPHTESWGCCGSNRPHISPQVPPISYWLMTHRAIMAFPALRIHSHFFSFRAPGEKRQQCEPQRHPKTTLSLNANSKWSLRQTSPCAAVQLCVATGSMWTATMEHRRDEKMERWRNI